jgi:hypothetical protein
MDSSIKKFNYDTIEHTSTILILDNDRKRINETINKIINKLELKSGFLMSDEDDIKTDVKLETTFFELSLYIDQNKKEDFQNRQVVILDNPDTRLETIKSLAMSGRHFNVTTIFIYDFFGNKAIRNLNPMIRICMDYVFILQNMCSRKMYDMFGIEDFYRYGDFCKLVRDQKGIIINNRLPKKVFQLYDYTNILDKYSWIPPKNILLEFDKYNHIILT